MFFFFFLLSVLTSAEEIYQNVTNICQRCSCDQDNAQIFSIDCSNQNFNYMLARWPSDKPTIKAVFTGNNFTTLEKLPPTHSEVQIVLTKCNIRYLEQSVFEDASRTTFVDLSYNFLNSESLTSDRFRGAYNDSRPLSVGVEHLNLAYNQIHTLYKNVFEYLPNLTTLNLEGNNFRVLDVHTQLALGKASTLTSLNLANNELTELVPGAIESLKNLAVLDLSKNELDFVPHSLKHVGETLQILMVDENPIIEMTEETFDGLPNIINISAKNLTKLKHIGPKAFATNLQLKKLSLRDNTKLLDIHPDAFSPNSTLEELDLFNCNLTTIPRNLLKWSELTTFDIGNNPLICDCDLADIVTSLPPSIVRPASGPTCHYPSTFTTSDVYELNADICTAKAQVRKYKISYQHLSIPMAGLFVTLAVALGAAAIMSYNRYKRMMPKRSDSFVSQVIYSPLLSPRA